jgi:hypothetical protein
MNDRLNRSQTGPELAIHIRELVVDGPRDIDHQRLATAIEAELGRLIGEHGVRLAAATHARLEGGTIDPLGGAAGHSGNDSTAVGRSVARVVHGAIGGNR